MRPIKLSIVPVTASANGFNATALTGTGPFTPTTTITTDSLGHKVTIVSGANLSAITLTLIGTDVDDNGITEAITAPNNTTVTGTKYFKTLTQVTASATLGASTMGLGWAAPSVTKTIPLEWRSNTGALLYADISGTINFTPQQTSENVYGNSSPSNSNSWYQAIAAGTADVAGAATVGAQAVRVLVNSVTNGATLDFYVSQASSSVA